MNSDAKVISFEEVCKHNHKEDCWIIIAGKVYDVTTFLDDHPGGDEVLLTSTEKDATDDFDGVGHGDAARRMLKEYYVGDFDMSTLPKGSTRPKVQFKLPPVVPSMANQNTRGGASLKLLLFVVPLLILVLAFALRNFAQKD